TEAVRIVYQTLRGLHHLHHQGIVHRNLEPSNLMLVPGPTETTAEATVKILDLGQALAPAEADEAAPAGEGLTRLGQLLGTPGYVAREQARDAHRADGRSDLYSVGCILYHALTGEPPLADENPLRQVLRHATESPRPLAEFGIEVPDGLQQVVSTLL